MSVPVSSNTVKMERSDSGPGTSTHELLKQESKSGLGQPAQLATPNSQMAGSPWTNVSSGFKNFSIGSIGSISPFTPSWTPSQPSAMSYLNVDSMPDHRLNAAAPSFSLPVQPIGSGSLSGSSNGETGEMSEGLVFTTESENFSGSRYVRVGNIPHHWAQNGQLQSALESSGILYETTSQVLISDGPTTSSLYMAFDDLRSAVACKEKFSMILTTVSFKFLDIHGYFAFDHGNPKAKAMSIYEGQVEFMAHPKVSIRGFNLYETYKNVLELAKLFGELRGFSFVESADFGPPKFRAEYFSLAAAETAVKADELKQGIFLSDVLTVTVEQYQAPGYRNYVHPAAAGDVAQLEAGVQGLGIDQGVAGTQASKDFRESSTKRTAWAGQQALVRDRNDNGREVEMARRRRGGLNNRNGRPKKHWTDVDEDSLLWTIDNSQWIRNQPQTVDIEKIERGVDVRTTIMLRNIPNRTQFEDLKDFMDETSFGQYDFSYLRIDFSNNCNVGYAFVNFIRPEYIVNFVIERVGKPWGIFNSEKRCEVSYATIQGIDCLLAKFRNSVVMEEFPGFRPKLWYHFDSTDMPEGMMVGDEAPFPAPNNEQKRKRSRDNASTVGLFPPRFGKGNRGGQNHFRDGQFDRGTPHAIEEERRFEEQRQVAYYDDSDEQNGAFYAGDDQQNLSGYYQGPQQNGITMGNGTRNMNINAGRNVRYHGREPAPHPHANASSRSPFGDGPTFGVGFHPGTYSGEDSDEGLDPRTIRRPRRRPT